MATKSTAPRNYVGLRDSDLARRLKELKELNPGRVNVSQIIRAAVEEYLDRIEHGEVEGITLKSRTSARGVAGDLSETVREAQKKTSRAARK